LSSEKGSYDEYDYLEEETIIKACNGDEMAQTEVIMRYDHYVRRVFRTVAKTSFNLNTNEIPVESLIQDVWIEILRIIVNKFE